MRKGNMSLKKAVSYGLILAAGPLLLLSGVFLFAQKQYAVISVLLAFAACLPFFLSFEKKKPLARQTVLIAVMVALSVAGRMAFAVLPSVKPVTALVIITALYFGPEAGFLTGSLSALLSNIYFGQGPWTPFQMFAWGILGFAAGLIRRPLQKHFWLLLLYSVLSGAVFSMLMDVYTVLSFGEGFRLDRYGAALLSALPVTAVYAVSNLAFMLMLYIPLGKALERIKRRYGL